mmetsp:Transcript_1213/g.3098  ORF Transcript_1213/g.3098 Transcript_1213/m.3098 type:complete len:223 (-) Transcript_1213:301-969(-)
MAAGLLKALPAVMTRGNPLQVRPLLVQQARVVAARYLQALFRPVELGAVRAELGRHGDPRRGGNREGLGGPAGGDTGRICPRGHHHRGRAGRDAGLAAGSRAAVWRRRFAGARQRLIVRAYAGNGGALLRGRKVVRAVVHFRSGVPRAKARRGTAAAVPVERGVLRAVGGPLPLRRRAVQELQVAGAVRHGVPGAEAGRVPGAAVRVAGPRGVAAVHRAGAA